MRNFCRTALSFVLILALAAASAFRRMGVPLEEALELVKLAYEEAGE